MNVFKYFGKELLRLCSKINQSDGVVYMIVEADQNGGPYEPCLGQLLEGTRTTGPLSIPEQRLP